MLHDRNRSNVGYDFEFGWIYVTYLQKLVPGPKYHFDEWLLVYYE